MVRTGLSEVIGSWKIIAISPPRSARSWRGERSGSSRPSKVTRPLLIESSAGSRPITASAVNDLPDPDSPTTARVPPAGTEMLTSRTRP